MGNVLDKCCGESNNTHFMFKNIFSENRALDELMSKNMVGPEAPNDVTT
jgi:hypothetical protein